MGVYVCGRLMGWWTENLKCAELEAVLAVIWQNVSLKVFLGGGLGPQICRQTCRNIDLLAYLVDVIPVIV